jgi:HD-GYP domain-containing protein (c-di-GMP phosphodiesterase class II)
VLARVEGREHALDTLRRRSGRAYDPEVVTGFLNSSDALFTTAETADPWDVWLQQDDPVPVVLDGEALDRALEVVADFADLKSPFTPGHSRGVAELAADAGRASGLAADDVTTLRRAALVHDLGRVCVPNSIWDKPGPLTHTERERMELHPLRTEQLLMRSTGLRALAAVAGAPHERVDGTGYPHHVNAAALPSTARLLAAADRLHAMTEVRPHRPAHTPEAAADELRTEARNGGLDPEAASAVLAAAGHSTTDRRAAQLYPDGLTAREVEVLRLLARGQTTKQIALALVISVKTADRHIQNAYGKIGASTRGAATLYAIERGLAQPRRDGP